MPKANELKRGAAVEFNGKKLIVKAIAVSNPSARGASTLYKVRFNEIPSNQKFEQTFKGDDILGDFDLERRQANFSYIDGEQYVFMDAEDYSQYLFSAEAIAEELLFITESTEGIQVLIGDGNPIAIELPQSVEMTISDCAPSLKGASASARTKPAEFSTGLIIQVPEYIANGETVKIHTSEKRFMSRAD